MMAEGGAGLLYSGEMGAWQFEIGQVLVGWYRLIILILRVTRSLYLCAIKVYSENE